METFINLKILIAIEDKNVQILKAALKPDTSSCHYEA